VKHRLIGIVALASFAVVLSFWMGSSSAIASGPDDGKYSYVGSKSCKKCHIKIYKSWEKTEGAKGFDALRVGKAAEAKTKYGLDPAKDYTKDESCLKCHTTGHGCEGGYAIPDEADKKAVKRAGTLLSHGCESCHGPGSEYVKLFKEIQKSKRKYKAEELYAVGLTKIDASACTNCHNDKSPTYDDTKKFDFGTYKDKDMHEHEELKQREE